MFIIPSATPERSAYGLFAASGLYGPDDGNPHVMNLVTDARAAGRPAQARNTCSCPVVGCGCIPGPERGRARLGCTGRPRSRWQRVGDPYNQERAMVPTYKNSA